MNTTIFIRHLANSSLAGRTQTFQQPIIRVGRKPDNDVVFNPELDLTVSGNHCRVVAEGSDLLIEDTGSTNGTYLNGLRIQGRVKVTGRDQIVLGERGPVIAASFGSSDAAGPSTIVGHLDGFPASGRAAGRDDVSARPVGLLDAGVDLPAAPIAATIPPVIATAYSPMAAGGAANALPIGPATPLELDRPPSRLSKGAKTSIGMNTLMSELEKATARERRRIVVVATPALLLLAAAVGAAWYLTRSEPSAVAVQPAPAAPPVTMPAPPLEWSAVLSPRKSAIYLVVSKRPNMEERPVGTAWSCGKGFLATNAHVAAEFLNRSQGTTFIARSNTNPPVDLRITSATLHPGYQAFENLVRTHPPVDLETGRPIVQAMPFDAALFEIEAADLAKQAEPLQLADEATLARVVETTELAYIGFPMEASVESGVNVKAPVAHQFIGNLTRKTDIFLAATSEDRATFLQYTLVVQGGASGSPVFNREGKVVGLISGNDHFFSESGRIAITGKSFGPRVDAVRDLLDKTADANTAPYVLEYRKHFRSIFDKALAGGKYDARKFQPAFGAFEILGIIRSNTPGNQGPPFKPSKADKKKEWTIELTDVGDAAGKTITSFPLTEAGVYCVAVWTDNPDVLPNVTLPALEENFQQLPPVATKVFQQKLGQGSSFVASWAIMRNVGDTMQFRVSGTRNGRMTKARMTAVLMRAAE